MSTPIPVELKSITPFITRANELTKADPVIAYWCTFYAVQHAMTLGSKDPECNVYLFSLMDKLEIMKQELDGNENVLSDPAASTYIEQFAGKIFAQAADEDRTGAGTRMTAKKFLAAGNFLELLTIFGEVSTDNREKIKYSKWKASDIAKAFREGRTPVPGPAGGLPPAPVVEEEQMSSEEAKELAKELAEMGVADKEVGGEEGVTQTTISPTAPEAFEDSDVPSYPFPQQPTTLPSSSAPIPPSIISTPSYTEPQTPLGEEHPTTPTFPSFLNTPTTVPGSSPSPISSGSSNNTPTIPFLPPPVISLPPPSHQTAYLPPPNTSQHVTKPVFASAVFPTVPPVSHQVPIATWSNTVPPVPIVPVAVPVPVDSLDPSVISTIQKHAKWAISALNYDDLVTARKELKAALLLLGE